MKLLSYKKTGYFYIDDDCEDKQGNPCEKKFCEYFFYFDDGMGCVLYLPETLPENFEFSENNISIQRAYRRICLSERLSKMTCQQQAEYHRPNLHYEYGHKDNFPLPKRRRAYRVPPINLLDLAEFDRQRWMQLTQQKNSVSEKIAEEKRVYADLVEA